MARARSAASATTCTRRCCTRCSRPAFASREGRAALARPGGRQVLVCGGGAHHRRGAPLADLRDARDRRNARRRGIPCTAVEKSTESGTTRARCHRTGPGRLGDQRNARIRSIWSTGRLLIRRQAIDLGVPLVTDLQLARAVVEASRWRKSSSLEVLALNDYVARDPDRRPAFRAMEW